MRVRSRSQPGAASSGYRVVNDPRPFIQTSGWKSGDVVSAQDAAYENLLRRMYEGEVRRDLDVAARLIAETGLRGPSLLEVGCGSGYYSEVLGHLCAASIAYTGSDFSVPMVTAARARYPTVGFVAGDGSKLPFRSGSFDIVMNGVALMHILDYEAAIAEASRVASGWCLFHTVPVVKRRPTTTLVKNAYGGEVVELVFNEKEIVGRFTAAGLEVESALESIEYNLEAVIGEKSSTRSFLCRKVSA